MPTPPIWQARITELERHAVMLAQALRHTQEYVGPDLLPALPGWSWFDALEAHKAMGLPDEVAITAPHQGEPHA